MISGPSNWTDRPMISPSRIPVYQCDFRFGGTVPKWSNQHLGSDCHAKDIHYYSLKQEIDSYSSVRLRNEEAGIFR